MEKSMSDQLPVPNPTERLKPVMDEVFRYQVGEVVSLAVDDQRLMVEMEKNGPVDVTRYRATPLVPLIITGRCILECHGGVQLMYEVRCNDVQAAITRRFEYELVPFKQSADRLVMTTSLLEEQIEQLKETLASIRSKTQGGEG